MTLLVCLLVRSFRPVADRRKEPSEVPEVPEAYAEQAGLIARVCIGKAGERLAGVMCQIVR